MAIKSVRGAPSLPFCAAALPAAALNASVSTLMETCVGRFLLPDCKRKSNYEGLGSSLTFHRATVAYSLLFNLTITSEPCARPQTSPFP